MTASASRKAFRAVNKTCRMWVVQPMTGGIPPIAVNCTARDA